MELITEQLDSVCCISELSLLRHLEYTSFPAEFLCNILNNNSNRIDSYRLNGYFLSEPEPVLFFIYPKRTYFIGKGQ